MNSILLLDRVREICHDIGQTRTLEALYKNLAHYLARISDSPSSAFMALVKNNFDGYTYQIIQGAGRYAANTDSILQDALISEHLRSSVSMRSNHYSHSAITFYFAHPEEIALLVYVELEQKIGAEEQKMLNFINDKVEGTIRAHNLTKQSMRTGRAMIIALASIAENKDRDTGEHILRVAIMTDEIVQVLFELGYFQEEITPEFKQYISSASILHDVGKVAIPDNILQKTGKLDPEERKIIETHTLAGKKVLEKARRILDSNNFLLNLSSDIALNHHEHYNGKGYPRQISGDEIPLSARIVGLADVFDALISERPYKNAWPEHEAISHICEQSGKQFDPLVIEAFLKVMECRQGLALIQWTEALSVKVPRMDHDHRGLISLINQLASAEKIGNRRVAESVLDELLNYTIDHFDHEEQYLKDSDYSSVDLVSHKLQHSWFSESIRDIRWQYLHGFRTSINQEVLLFLRDWLSNHILIEDMKYAKRACAEG